MRILAIETSCDDTCAAVLENDRVLSNVISSQIDLHKVWGGVVPDIAKRAHTERIEPVIVEALKKAKISNFKFQISKQKEKIIEEGIKNIDVIAVTQGPGLAVALGIGIGKAKELAIKYNKKLVAVNHIEGHIMSNFVKNRNGNPKREIKFPALCLTVSGGHTQIILINQNDQFSNSNFQFSKKRKVVKSFQYQIVGETLDDAAGEALDKAAKVLELGYPGGPIMERLAKTGNEKFLDLPRPMRYFKTLDYSFSGLKTSFYYKIKNWPKKKVQDNLADLVASYQKAVFESLLIKYKQAIERYKVRTLLGCGGVMANKTLRKELRKMARKEKLPIFMPYKRILNTDNAAMIGIAGYYKALKGEFVKNIEGLDREARMRL